MSLKTVVIAGRMNVGKSTLWNRIVGGQAALVSPIAGTTRDWREGKTDWRGVSFRLLDTGGIENQKLKTKNKKQKTDNGDIGTAVEEMTRRVIKKADAILFLVDGRDGLLPQDRELARLVLNEKKPIVLAVNKVDSPRERSAVAEFWKLGCGEPHPVSAQTGAGVGDLLDVVITKTRNHEITESQNHEITESPALHLSDNQPLRIAIIGKPNVGKSSLVNAILGEERVIVSPFPGTTREPIDTEFEINEKQYAFIDTAGIRRRAERIRTLEAAGVERTIFVLKRSDIALLIIEANEPLASQDLRIARTLIDATVGVIIIANKWDIFGKSQIPNSKSQTDVIKRYTDYLRRQMPHIEWAPILFISAKTGRNVQKIISAIETVRGEREKIIPEETLRQWLKRLTYRQAKSKTRKPHVYGIKQTGINPPTFELVTEFRKVPTRQGKQKSTVRESYFRFLENQLRVSFGFIGTPIVFKLRAIE